VVASKKGCFTTYKAGRCLVLSHTAPFYDVKIKFASILLGGGPSSLGGALLALHTPARKATTHTTKSNQQKKRHGIAIGWLVGFLSSGSLNSLLCTLRFLPKYTLSFPFLSNFLPHTLYRSTHTRRPNSYVIHSTYPLSAHRHERRRKAAPRRANFFILSACQRARVMFPSRLPLKMIDISHCYSLP